MAAVEFQESLDVAMEQPQRLIQAEAAKTERFLALQKINSVAPTHGEAPAAGDAVGTDGRRLIKESQERRMSEDLALARYEKT